MLAGFKSRWITLREWAYVIASQRDVSRLPEVVALTDAVINNSGATVMTAAEVTGGFNNVNTSGWIILG